MVEVVRRKSQFTELREILKSHTVHYEFHNTLDE
jgi:hypothetical protein